MLCLLCWLTAIDHARHINNCSDLVVYTKERAVYALIIFISIFGGFTKLSLIEQLESETWSEKVGVTYSNKLDSN